MWVHLIQSDENLMNKKTDPPPGKREFSSWLPSDFFYNTGSVCLTIFKLSVGILHHWHTLQILNLLASMILWANSQISVHSFQKKKNHFHASLIFLLFIISHIIKFPAEQ